MRRCGRWYCIYLIFFYIFQCDKMFLLFFLIFTLIFTTLENLSIAGISLLSILLVLLAYGSIGKKRMLLKGPVMALLGWFLLAGIAFGVKEYRYYGDIQGWQRAIIWTWVISDISNQGKYVFTYDNKDYLLYATKEYSIWDQIRMVWRLQENTKKAWFSYRMISTWTFDIPLFSWSFDFSKWMKMKGRNWTIYEDNSIVDNEWSGAHWIGPIKQMKKWLQEIIIKTYGKNRISGLILGMLIGDRSQIPESEYQNFINSGLVHLVAVSGGNILMIVVFLQCILFFLPYYIRLGIMLLAIVGYWLICWLDSSVFRAVLMGGISMIALFRGREIHVWRLLSISCIIMLIINPYFLAYDSGFLLSYTALIGIICFETKQQSQIGSRKVDKSRIKRWLRYMYKSYISPSIWASIGIFPIIIFFMGKINLLSIIVNMLVLPVVPFVMIYGFVSVWLWPWLRWEWLLIIEKYFILYIYKISDFFSQYGLYFTVSGLRIKYAILGISLVFFVIWYLRNKDGDRNMGNEKIGTMSEK